MPPTRVLIAEDSPTVRRLLETIVESDPALRLVGSADNGVDAVELADKLRPGVVTMDVQMPRLDGFAATRQIMERCPLPVVIVSGHVDVRERRASLEALGAGAVALLPKPPGPDSPDFERARLQFVETLKAMAEVKVVHRWTARSARLPERQQRSSDRPMEAAAIVALAASTGGPPALRQVLSTLPADFPAPIVVVQHIAQGFGAGLAEWLDGTVKIPVVSASHGAVLRPGCVYVAPDDAHLTVARPGVAALRKTYQHGPHKPSADALFESVALAYGPRACAVIMTGMGADGVRGLAELFARGARVIAQDEKSSVVYGMPKAAVEAGVVHRVAALNDIAGLLVEAVHR